MEKMKQKKKQRHFAAAFLVVMMIASVLAIVPMAGADTGNVLEDFKTSQYACPGYANVVWADVDGDGTYDTQVVFTTNTGVAWSLNGWYFFSGIDVQCGGAAPWDRGRFVIHFVDMLAPGFVWNNPGTWTYKRISSLSVKASHDLCVASGDWSTAYQSIQAYRNRFQNDQIGACKLVAGPGEPTEMKCEFSDATGIMELYYSTDFCENLLHYLILRTAPVVDTDGDGIPDDDETAGWDITRYNCDGSILDTYHVTSDPNLVDTDGDGLTDLEEKEGWHVSYTISTGPVAYDVQSNPGVVDYDGDGKNDAEEKTAGTDPNRRDTDCDGAYDTNDGFEIDNGLNPLHFDTDSDGVSDGEEIDLWMDAGYSLNDAIEKTKDPESIPLIPELCPDEYRWNTSVSLTGYEWDPFPELFRSWTDVHFVNCGSGDAFNVVASISYAPANVNIVDADVTLGDMPAGSGAWSSDFFELEVDMTNPQDPNEGIEWTVEYDDTTGNHHVVPGVPEFCAPG